MIVWNGWTVIIPQQKSNKKTLKAAHSTNLKGIWETLFIAPTDFQKTMCNGWSDTVYLDIIATGKYSELL